MQSPYHFNFKELCQIAGVSKSGYYNWLASKDKRLEKEAKDKHDFELILEAYSFRGYEKDIRSIHMRLLHMNPPILMNTKKIQRLMHKHGFVYPIRKTNPYRRMAKALKTDAVSDNLLNREFKEHGPRKVLLTDITYIPCRGIFFYLSVIKDVTIPVRSSDKSFRIPSFANLCPVVGAAGIMLHRSISSHFIQWDKQNQ